MKIKNRFDAKLRRKLRARQKISGTQERPRLSVYRSLKHIYAQLIDDTQAITLASASSLEKTTEITKRSKTQWAERVGGLIGQEAIKKGIKKVVFDRGGCLYHGRIKALAEAARKAGLEF